MTELGTAFAPRGVCGSSNEFDFVERVVDEGLKVLLWGKTAVERETGPDTQNDLEIHVLGPFKILHETETISLLVAPDALETRAVTKRAN